MVLALVSAGGLEQGVIKMVLVGGVCRRPAWSG